MSEKKVVAAVWTCSVSGPVAYADIPPGSDLPMRQAVRAAYRSVTGQEETRLSSGWGMDDPPFRATGPLTLGPAPLDAAWAEAEAALPEGSNLALALEQIVGGVHARAFGVNGDYEAEGPTPADALRALAAKLREVGR